VLLSQIICVIIILGYQCRNVCTACSYLVLFESAWMAVSKWQCLQVWWVCSMVSLCICLFVYLSVCAWLHASWMLLTWYLTHHHHHHHHILHITIPKMHHNNVSSVSGFCSMNTNILCYMSEYLNTCYILAETGTRRYVIMMHFRNQEWW